MRPPPLLEPESMAQNELIEYVARGLVDAPDEVEVRQGEPQEDGTAVWELQVAPDDRGKVIGKKGRVAHSLRTLLHAMANAPVGLEIVD